MTPQEHYDEAERIVGYLDDSVTTPRNNPAIHLALASEALVHATLAGAGFTRDAATGANHVHDFNAGMRVVAEGGHGPVYSNRDTTDPGRPA